MKNINKRLGRGVNILGYDPIWKERAQGRMQARHFRLIREAGFNHVRINLHPYKHMGAEPGYELAPAWLETLDWALAQCKENGLLAILDLHEFGAMGEDPDGLKPKFLAFWRQAAGRYRDEPESVFFEILNEPNSALTVELWNEMLKEALALIRATNPARTVIIGPGYWNGIDFLDQLQLPEEDRNLIATVHYYHPMSFTHQGAAWAPEFKDQTGVRWLGLAEEQALIRKELGGAQAWAQEHKRPVLLGEFGAYDKGEMDSRARYTSFVAREAERLGWSWAYWQFDSDFIAYDIPHERWVEPIRDALIPNR